MPKITATVNERLNAQLEKYSSRVNQSKALIISECLDVCLLQYIKQSEIELRKIASELASYSSSNQINEAKLRDAIAYISSKESAN